MIYTRIFVWENSLLQISCIIFICDLFYNVDIPTSLFQVVGELDFTVLPVPTAKDLKADNGLLRRKFYTGIANAEDMLQTIRLVKNQLNNFFMSHYLEVTENELPAEDILKHLLENTLVLNTTDDITTISLDEVKSKDYPVSYPILVSEKLLQKIDRTYCTSRVKNIGFCHLFVNDMRDSATSSYDSYDSQADDVVSSARKRKRTKKTCGVQKWVNCDGNLVLHEDNSTRIGNIVVVDTLIFCEKRDVCRSLASHFGFIFLDDLMETSEEFESYTDMGERRAEISHRLSNRNAKLYREVQSLMNQKIIFGFNTICFTSYMHLFKNAKASIKATINEKEISDLCLEASQHSSIVIRVKENCILQYIVAIAEIIAHALNCNFEMTAVYCKVEKVGEEVKKKFYNVQFPLAGVIPLYILRLVAQLCKENPKNRNACQDI